MERHSDPCRLIREMALAIFGTDDDFTIELREGPHTDEVILSIPDKKVRELLMNRKHRGLDAMQRILHMSSTWHPRRLVLSLLEET